MDSSELDDLIKNYGVYSDFSCETIPVTLPSNRITVRPVLSSILSSISITLCVNDRIISHIGMHLYGVFCPRYSSIEYCPSNGKCVDFCFFFAEFEYQNIHKLIQKELQEVDGKLTIQINHFLYYIINIMNKNWVCGRQVPGGKSGPSFSPLGLPAIPG